MTNVSTPQKSPLCIWSFLTSQLKARNFWKLLDAHQLETIKVNLHRLGIQLAGYYVSLWKVYSSPLVSLLLKMSLSNDIKFQFSLDFHRPALLVNVEPFTPFSVHSWPENKFKKFVTCQKTLIVCTNGIFQKLSGNSIPKSQTICCYNSTLDVIWKLNCWLAQSFWNLSGINKYQSFQTTLQTHNSNLLSGLFLLQISGFKGTFSAW